MYINLSSFIADEEETAPLFKSVAARFQQYFNFGRFVWPTVEDYRQIGLGLADDTYVLPAILVLVPNEPKMMNDMAFSAIEYDPKVMGRLFYPNVVHFLFTINHNYRHWLPGQDMSSVQSIVEMRDILDIESQRFEVFMGGKPYESEIKKSKDKTKNTSNETSSSSADKGDETNETLPESEKHRDTDPEFKDEL